MIDSSLIKLGWANVRNSVAEAVYIKTGADYTRPVSFHALVLEECNVKCRFCNYWRLPEYKKQLSIEQWKEVLTEIRDFVGTFHINFSGGEPFTKKGFPDLLKWAGENDILAGVTTNGSVMNEKMAARVVDAKPFNVNFSLDSPEAEMHDYLRGAPGLFEKILNGIRYLQAGMRSTGTKFQIVFKMCVTAANFELMPKAAELARDMEVDGILFQPVQEVTDEVTDELWIEEEKHGRLEEIIEQMVRMRDEGYPILSSPKFMRLMLPHFRREEAPKDLQPCRVGMRSFHIQPDGNVELCYKMPTVGKLGEQSVREIWRGPAAQAIRQATIECPELCLCMGGSMFTAKEKFEQVLRMGRG